MNTITNKLWFKLIALLVVQAFLVCDANIVQALEDQNKRQRDIAQELSQNAPKAQMQEIDINQTTYSPLSTLNLPQAGMPGTGIEPGRYQTEQERFIGASIIAMKGAGYDLPSIAIVLKQSGSSAKDVAMSALKEGYFADDIYEALIKAGYSKEEADNLISKQLRDQAKTEKEKQAQDKTLTEQDKEKIEREKIEKEYRDKIKLETKPVEIIEEEKPEMVKVSQEERQKAALELIKALLSIGKDLKGLVDAMNKAGYTDSEIVKAYAMLGKGLDEIVILLKSADRNASSIVAAIKDAGLNFGNYDIYQALIKSGYSDAEIVKAFEQANVACVEVLKIATQLNRNMVTIAQAMIDAGYEAGEIVGSYVSKAVNWVKDATVNLINCAVNALKALLSQKGQDIDKQKLAYDLILQDILSEGEVVVRNNDVFSSMYALKQIAKKYAINLDGYEMDLESLIKTDRPMIVHFTDHWVTVIGVKDGQVTVIDNGQKKTMTTQEFARAWDGKVLSDKAVGKFTRLTEAQMKKVLGASSDSRAAYYAWLRYLAWLAMIRRIMEAKRRAEAAKRRAEAAKKRAEAAKKRAEAAKKKAEAAKKKAEAAKKKPDTKKTVTNKNGSKTTTVTRKDKKDGSTTTVKTTVGRNGKQQSETITVDHKNGSKTTVETKGDGKKKSSEKVTHKDKDGTTTVETKYGKDGKTRTSEKTTHKDKEGTTTVDTKYGSDGKTPTSETITNTDSSGTTKVESKYGSDGKTLTSQTVTNKDKEGTTKIVTQFNNGKITQEVETVINNDGSSTATTTSYNPKTGGVTQISSTLKDSSGKTTGTAEANFDSNGNMTSSKATVINADGSSKTTTTTYNPNNGKPTHVSTVNKDSSGTETGSFTVDITDKGILIFSTNGKITADMVGQTMQAAGRTSAADLKDAAMVSGLINTNGGINQEEGDLLAQVAKSAGLDISSSDKAASVAMGMGITSIAGLSGFADGAGITKPEERGAFFVASGIISDDDLAQAAKESGLGGDFSGLGLFAKGAGLNLDMTRLAKFFNNFDLFSPNNAVGNTNMVFFLKAAGITTGTQLTNFVIAYGINNFYSTDALTNLAVSMGLNYEESAVFARGIGRTSLQDLTSFAQALCLSNPEEIGRFFSAAGITKTEDLVTAAQQLGIATNNESLGLFAKGAGLTGQNFANFVKGMGVDLTTAEGVERLGAISDFAKLSAAQKAEVALGAGLKTDSQLSSFAKGAKIDSSNPQAAGEFVAGIKASLGWDNAKCLSFGKQLGIDASSDPYKFGLFAKTAGLGDPGQLITDTGITGAQAIGDFLRGFGVTDPYLAAAIAGNNNITGVEGLTTFLTALGIQDRNAQGQFFVLAGIKDAAGLTQAARRMGIIGLGEDLGNFMNGALSKLGGTQFDRLNTATTIMNSFASGSDPLFMAENIATTLKAAGITETSDVAHVITGLMANGFSFNNEDLATVIKTMGWNNDYQKAGAFVAIMGRTSDEDVMAITSALGISDISQGNRGNLGRFLAACFGSDKAGRTRLINYFNSNYGSYGVGNMEFGEVAYGAGIRTQAEIIAFMELAGIKNDATASARFASGVCKTADSLVLLGHALGLNGDGLKQYLETASQANNKITLCWNDATHNWVLVFNQGKDQGTSSFEFDSTFAPVSARTVDAGGNTTSERAYKNGDWDSYTETGTRYSGVPGSPDNTIPRPYSVTVEGGKITAVQFYTTYANGRPEGLIFGKIFNADGSWVLVIHNPAAAAEEFGSTVPIAYNANGTPVTLENLNPSDYGLRQPENGTLSLYINAKGVTIDGKNYDIYVVQVTDGGKTFLQVIRRESGSNNFEAVGGVQTEQKNGAETFIIADPSNNGKALYVSDGKGSDAVFVNGNPISVTDAQTHLRTETTYDNQNRPLQQLTIPIGTATFTQRLVFDYSRPNFTIINAFNGQGLQVYQRVLDSNNRLYSLVIYNEQGLPITLSEREMGQIKSEALDVLSQLRTDADNDLKNATGDQRKDLEQRINNYGEIERLLSSNNPMDQLNGIGMLYTELSKSIIDLTVDLTAYESGGSGVSGAMDDAYVKTSNNISNYGALLSKLDTWQLALASTLTGEDAVKAFAQIDLNYSAAASAINSEVYGDLPTSLTGQRAGLEEKVGNQNGWSNAGDDAWTFIVSHSPWAADTAYERQAGHERDNIRLAALNSVINSEALKTMLSDLADKSGAIENIFKSMPMEYALFNLDKAQLTAAVAEERANGSDATLKGNVDAEIKTQSERFLNQVYAVSMAYGGNKFRSDSISNIDGLSYTAIVERMIATANDPANLGTYTDRININSEDIKNLLAMARELDALVGFRSSMDRPDFYQNLASFYPKQDANNSSGTLATFVQEAWVVRDAVMTSDAAQQKLSAAEAIFADMSVIQQHIEQIRQNGVPVEQGTSQEMAQELADNEIARLEAQLSGLGASFGELLSSAVLDLGSVFTNLNVLDSARFLRESAAKIQQGITGSIPGFFGGGAQQLAQQQMASHIAQQMLTATVNGRAAFAMQLLNFNKILLAQGFWQGMDTVKDFMLIDAGIKITAAVIIGTIVAIAAAILTAPEGGAGGVGVGAAVTTFVLTTAACAAAGLAIGFAAACIVSGIEALKTGEKFNWNRVKEWSRTGLMIGLLIGVTRGYGAVHMLAAEGGALGVGGAVASQFSTAAVLHTLQVTGVMAGIGALGGSVLYQMDPSRFNSKLDAMLTGAALGAMLGLSSISFLATSTAASFSILQASLAVLKTAGVAVLLNGGIKTWGDYSENRDINLSSVLNNATFGIFDRNLTLGARMARIGDFAVALMLVQSVATSPFLSPDRAFMFVITNPFAKLAIVSAIGAVVGALGTVAYAKITGEEITWNKVISGAITGALAALIITAMASRMNYVNIQEGMYATPQEYEAAVEKKTVSEFFGRTTAEGQGVPLAYRPMGFAGGKMGATMAALAGIRGAWAGFVEGKTGKDWFNAVTFGLFDSEKSFSEKLSALKDMAMQIAMVYTGAQFARGQGMLLRGGQAQGEEVDELGGVVAKEGNMFTRAWASLKAAPGGVIKGWGGAKWIGQYIGEVIGFNLKNMLADPVGALFNAGNVGHLVALTSFVMTVGSAMISGKDITIKDVLEAYTEGWNTGIGFGFAMQLAQPSQDLISRIPIFGKGMVSLAEKGTIKNNLTGKGWNSAFLNYWDGVIYQEWCLEPLVGRALNKTGLPKDITNIIEESSFPDAGGGRIANEMISNLISNITQTISDLISNNASMETINTQIAVFQAELTSVLGTIVNLQGLMDVTPEDIDVLRVQIGQAIDEYNVKVDAAGQDGGRRISDDERAALLDNHASSGALVSDLRAAAAQALPSGVTRADVTLLNRISRNSFLNAGYEAARTAEGQAQKQAIYNLAACVARVDATTNAWFGAGFTEIMGEQAYENAATPSQWLNFVAQRLNDADVRAAIESNQDLSREQKDNLLAKLNVLADIAQKFNNAQQSKNPITFAMLNQALEQSPSVTDENGNEVKLVSNTDLINLLLPGLDTQNVEAILLCGQLLETIDPKLAGNVAIQTVIAEVFVNGASANPAQNLRNFVALRTTNSRVFLAINSLNELDTDGTPTMRQLEVIAEQLNRKGTDLNNTIKILAALCGVNIIDTQIARIRQSVRGEAEVALNTAVRLDTAFMVADEIKQGIADNDAEYEGYKAETPGSIGNIMKLARDLGLRGENEIGAFFAIVTDNAISAGNIKSVLEICNLMGNDVAAFVSATQLQALAQAQENGNLNSVLGNILTEIEIYLNSPLAEGQDSNRVKRALDAISKLQGALVWAVQNNSRADEITGRELDEASQSNNASKILLYTLMFPGMTNEQRTSVEAFYALSDALGDISISTVLSQVRNPNATALAELVSRTKGVDARVSRAANIILTANQEGAADNVARLAELSLQNSNGNEEESMLTLAVIFQLMDLNRGDTMSFAMAKVITNLVNRKADTSKISSVAALAEFTQKLRDIHMEFRLSSLDNEARAEKLNEDLAKLGADYGLNLDFAQLRDIYDGVKSDFDDNPFRIIQLDETTFRIDTSNLSGTALKLAEIINKQAETYFTERGINVTERFGINQLEAVAKLLLTENTWHRISSGVGKTDVIFGLAASVRAEAVKDGIFIGQDGNGIGGRTIFVLPNVPLFENTANNTNLNAFFAATGVGSPALFTEDDLHTVAQGGQAATDVLTRIENASVVYVVLDTLNFLELDYELLTSNNANENTRKLYDYIFGNNKFVFDEVDTTMEATGVQQGLNERGGLAEETVSSIYAIDAIIGDLTVQEYILKAMYASDGTTQVSSAVIDEIQKAIDNNKSKDNTPITISQLSGPARLAAERSLMTYCVYTNNETQEISFGQYYRYGGQLYDTKIRDSRVLDGVATKMSEQGEAVTADNLDQMLTDGTIDAASSETRGLFASLVGRAKALRQVEGRDIGTVTGETDIKVMVSNVVAPRLRQSDPYLAAHTQVVFQRIAVDFAAYGGEVALKDYLGTELQVSGESKRSNMARTLAAIMANGSDLSGFSGTLSVVMDAVSSLYGITVVEYDTTDQLFSEGGKRQIIDESIINCRNQDELIAGLIADVQASNNPHQVFLNGQGMMDETPFLDMLKTNLLLGGVLEELIVKDQENKWVRYTVKNGEISEPEEMEFKGENGVETYLSQSENRGRRIGIYFNYAATRGTDVVFVGTADVHEIIDTETTGYGFRQLEARDRGVQLKNGQTRKYDYVFAETREAANAFRSGELTVSDIYDSESGQLRDGYRFFSEGETAFPVLHPTTIHVIDASGEINTAAALQARLEANDTLAKKQMVYRTVTDILEGSHTRFLEGLMANTSGEAVDILTKIKGDYLRQIGMDTDIRLGQAQSGVEGLQNTVNRIRATLAEAIYADIASGTTTQEFNQLPQDIQNALMSELEALSSNGTIHLVDEAQTTAKNPALANSLSEAVPLVNQALTQEMLPEVAPLPGTNKGFIVGQTFDQAVESDETLSSLDDQTKHRLQETLLARGLMDSNTKKLTAGGFDLLKIIIALVKAYLAENGRASVEGAMAIAGVAGMAAIETAQGTSRLITDEGEIRDKLTQLLGDLQGVFEREVGSIGNITGLSVPEAEDGRAVTVTAVNNAGEVISFQVNAAQNALTVIRSNNIASFDASGNKINLPQMDNAVSLALNMALKLMGSGAINQALNILQQRAGNIDRGEALEYLINNLLSAGKLVDTFGMLLSWDGHEEMGGTLAMGSANKLVEIMMGGKSALIGLLGEILSEAKDDLSIDEAGRADLDRIAQNINKTGVLLLQDARTLAEVLLQMSGIDTSAENATAELDEKTTEILQIFNSDITLEEYKKYNSMGTQLDGLVNSEKPVTIAQLEQIAAEFTGDERGARVFIIRLLNPGISTDNAEKLASAIENLAAIGITEMSVQDVNDFIGKPLEERVKIIEQSAKANKGEKAAMGTVAEGLAAREKAKTEAAKNLWEQVQQAISGIGMENPLSISVGLMASLRTAVEVGVISKDVLAEAEKIGLNNPQQLVSFIVQEVATLRENRQLNTKLTVADMQSVIAEAIELYGAKMSVSEKAGLKTKLIRAVLIAANPTADLTTLERDYGLAGLVTAETGVDIDIRWLGEDLIEAKAMATIAAAVISEATVNAQHAETAPETSGLAKASTELEQASIPGLTQGAAVQAMQPVELSAVDTAKVTQNVIERFAAKYGLSAASIEGDKLNAKVSMLREFNNMLAGNERLAAQFSELGIMGKIEEFVYERNAQGQIFWWSLTTMEGKIWHTTAPEDIVFYEAAKYVVDKLNDSLQVLTSTDATPEQKEAARNNLNAELAKYGITLSSDEHEQKLFSLAAQYRSKPDEFRAKLDTLKEESTVKLTLRSIVEKLENITILSELLGQQILSASIDDMTKKIEKDFAAVMPYIVQRSAESGKPLLSVIAELAGVDLDKLNQGTKEALVRLAAAAADGGLNAILQAQGRQPVAEQTAEPVSEDVKLAERIGSNASVFVVDGLRTMGNGQATMFIQAEEVTDTVTNTSEMRYRIYIDSETYQQGADKLAGIITAGISQIAQDMPVSVASIRTNNAEPVILIATAKSVEGTIETPLDRPEVDTSAEAPQTEPLTQPVDETVSATEADEPAANAADEMPQSTTEPVEGVPQLTDDVDTSAKAQTTEAEAETEVQAIALPDAQQTFGEAVIEHMGGADNITNITTISAQTPGVNEAEIETNTGNVYRATSIRDSDYVAVSRVNNETHQIETTMIMDKKGTVKIEINEMPGIKPAAPIDLLQNFNVIIGGFVDAGIDISNVEAITFNKDMKGNIVTVDIAMADGTMQLVNANNGAVLERRANDGQVLEIVANVNGKPQTIAIKAQQDNQTEPVAGYSLLGEETPAGKVLLASGVWTSNVYAAGNQVAGFTFGGVENKKGETKIGLYMNSAQRQNAENNLGRIIGSVVARFEQSGDIAIKTIHVEIVRGRVAYVDKENNVLVIGEDLLKRTITIDGNTESGLGAQEPGKAVEATVELMVTQGIAHLISHRSELIAAETAVQHEAGLPEGEITIAKAIIVLQMAQIVEQRARGEAVNLVSRVEQAGEKLSIAVAQHLAEPRVEGAFINQALRDTIARLPQEPVTDPSMSQLGGNITVKEVSGLRHNTGAALVVMPEVTDRGAGITVCVDRSLYNIARKYNNLSALADEIKQQVKEQQKQQKAAEIVETGTTAVKVATAEIVIKDLRETAKKDNIKEIQLLVVRLGVINTEILATDEIVGRPDDKTGALPTELDHKLPHGLTGPGGLFEREIGRRPVEIERAL